VPARLIKIKYITICVEKVASPITALQNGWMDQGETRHEGRPRPWPHCVRWRPSSPPPKGDGAPNFSPISVVAKWLDGSRCHLAGT